MTEFGDDGSLTQRMIHGDYEGLVMERIKDEDMPKAKYQVFCDLMKVMWFWDHFRYLVVNVWRLL